ncbi:MAG: CDP-glycerol glycerophosphotransferase family protein [Bacteroidaceae bacterium]|nr:CDP-glycerol glycerophosphotransferase family protein [Bacteroidaceae bacterium]
MERNEMTTYRRIERTLRLKTSIFLYNLHLNFLVRRIAKRRPVRVMFYVNNLSMWKSDKLLMLLKKDSRFEPFVASLLYPKDSLKIKKHIEKELSEHFNSLGVSFTSGFNFDKNRQYPFYRFKADLVFFPQPYINNLKHVPLNALLSYIPYGFSIEDSPRFHNSLYQNICWKYFATSSLQKEMNVKYNYNHGANVIISGDPLADYFLDGHTPNYNWPIGNPKLKRIIWAPHHSINSQDWLDHANFLKIADPMLEIAKKYSDKVQFIFKPHPMLKEKLYKNELWGIERTDAYYNDWNTFPNCRFADGNYVDLFMTSDAMIHDCSAFTAEYLYVNKPVMYVTEKEKIESFNAFADECFQVHYHGSSIRDIEAFIDNVISGTDPLLDERTRLVNEKLLPKTRETVAGTIYNELCKLFE